MTMDSIVVNLLHVGAPKVRFFFMGFQVWTIKVDS